jgi:hypothetical protein
MGALMKVGERLQIPNDGYGNPVLEFDRKTKKYGPGLQWFEVTRLHDNGNILLKPVWPLNPPA